MRVKLIRIYNIEQQTQELTFIIESKFVFVLYRQKHSIAFNNWRKGVPTTGAPVPIYPLNIRNTRIVIFFKLHFFGILLYWIFPLAFKLSANNKKEKNPPTSLYGSIVYKYIFTALVFFFSNSCNQLFNSHSILMNLETRHRLSSLFNDYLQLIPSDIATFINRSMCPQIINYYPCELI